MAHKIMASSEANQNSFAPKKETDHNELVDNTQQRKIKEKTRRRHSAQTGGRRK